MIPAPDRHRIRVLPSVRRLLARLARVKADRFEWENEPDASTSTGWPNPSSDPLGDLEAAIHRERDRLLVGIDPATDDPLAMIAAASEPDGRHDTFVMVQSGRGFGKTAAAAAAITDARVRGLSVEVVGASHTSIKEPDPDPGPDRLTPQLRGAVFAQPLHARPYPPPADGPADDLGDRILAVLDEQGIDLPDAVTRPPDVEPATTCIWSKVDAEGRPGFKCAAHGCLKCDLPRCIRRRHDEGPHHLDNGDGPT